MKSTEEKYESEKNIALKEMNYSKENLERLISNIPEKVLTKEEKLHSSLIKAKIGNEKKLLRIYEFYDLVSEAISPYTPCKKGCSSCCHYNVAITEDEAKLIQRNSDKKRRKTLEPAKDYHGEPCPFLSGEGSCTIYNFRPYSCRRHYALTKTNFLCAPSKSNDFEVSLLRFSEAEAVFDALRTNQDIHDIRQYFA